MSGQNGTKFRLYPQPRFLEGFGEPELVRVSSPAGSLRPGPGDHRMRVIRPRGKDMPYGYYETDRGDPYVYMPPWDGKTLRSVRPNAAGHFDHLEPGTADFEAAHLFGCARFVLDVWEGYFGGPLEWHFSPDFERLEMVLLPGFDNATLGYGFMEVGGHTEKDGTLRPFGLNFDVIAHEIGHAIIYSQVGIPDPEEENGEYYGFHESAADLVALLAALHFDSVVDDVLESTAGNIYALNKINRIAELSQNDEIRMAANDSVMDDFAEGWTKEHLLSQPLTGAMFDILVDIFHEQLLDRGLITPEVEALSDRIEGHPEYVDMMQGHFDLAYGRDPEGFKDALLEARDYLGTYLADAWPMLDPDILSYQDVRHALDLVDRETTGGAYLRLIHGNFDTRGIGYVVPGPRLKKKKDKNSHGQSIRTMVPEFL